MIISHSQKFIFVHIHKTGGSSLSLALQPFLAWNDLILGGSPLGEKTNHAFRAQYGLHKHSTLEEIKTVCGTDILDAYYSFALVREPIAKAVSLYNYIAGFSRELAADFGRPEAELAAASISGTGGIDHNFLRWEATRAYYQSNSFSDFIRAPETLSDMGFRPQIASLRTDDGTYMVQKIIKLEDVLHRLPDLWEALGFRFYLPHINRATLVKQPPDKISKADRYYLKDLFADDYLALEYPA